MRDRAGSAAAPAARCKNLRRGSFILNPPFTSFDYLVGAREQHRWDFESERLGGLEIDHQLEFRRVFNRQLGSLCSIENLDNERRGAAAQIRDIRAVRDQPAVIYKVPRLVHCRKAMHCSQFRDPPPSREELRIGEERQRASKPSRAMVENIVGSSLKSERVNRRNSKPSKGAIGWTSSQRKGCKGLSVLTSTATRRIPAAASLKISMRLWASSVPYI